MWMKSVLPWMVTNISVLITGVDCTERDVKKWRPQAKLFSCQSCQSSNCEEAVRLSKVFCRISMAKKETKERFFFNLQKNTKYKKRSKIEKNFKDKEKGKRLLLKAFVANKQTKIFLSVFYLCRLLHCNMLEVILIRAKF